MQGRDASSLFRGESEKWDDVAFLRSTSNGQPWLAAVTDRYKLVYSSLGQPWLSDLKADPDELQNAFGKPGSKPIIQDLTKRLSNYAKRTRDPYVNNKQIKTDMAQALGQTG